MKKFMILIMTVFVFISITIFTSINATNPYLSISYTIYNDKKGPEGGMTTNIIIYDIKNKKLEKLDGVEYTSQYPLGVYSKVDNKIYYSAENKKTKGDELFSFDLKTGKVEQLTDDLFAINEIIPRKNDIILVAVKRNTSALRLINYNKLTKEMNYENLEDDDTDTWSIGINFNDNNEFYTSTYSQSQRYKNAEMEWTREADKFYYPDSTVYKYSGDLKNKEKIMFFEKEKVEAISATDKYLLLSISKELADPLKDKAVIVDLDTKKQEEIVIKDYHIGITALAPDNKTIFFIGYPIDKDKKRGIYQYDMQSKQVKEIFIQEDGIGFINNFRLLNN